MTVFLVNDYIKIKRTGIVNWVGIERQALLCKLTENNRQLNPICWLDPALKIL
ncbi:hypothetical protein VII00023_14849 [Vibrio ichthyoenteri ATCC 700023]|uniref:Uncharacterized protein n=1 Tax=Vibrio ichthyoenteri ATCC 700023 TaxID=870968 RepID=F9S880_9VIBR|nr:hypothetical protein VII00023_14849 [Vibrio ichthyoenteri ATCC 700023]